LRTVAPVYGAIGLGMALYFASQGAKRVLWPVLAGTMRMLVAAGVGWAAVTWLGAGLSTLFQIVALAAVLFGLVTAAAVLGGAWDRGPGRGNTGPRRNALRQASISTLSEVCACPDSMSASGEF
jgi:hypothetical protein